MSSVLGFAWEFQHGRVSLPTRYVLPVHRPGGIVLHPTCYSLKLQGQLPLTCSSITSQSILFHDQTYIPGRVTALGGHHFATICI